jgi:demethylmenaquinone methyltransferase/2-methoxy-6-polyprenyl-1,4-benzoquinol methylase
MNSFLRLKSLDTLRGLLIVLMIIEHARYFSTRCLCFIESSRFPVRIYNGDIGESLIRMLSHLCAPGFFFVLGFGMVLASQRAISQQALVRSFLRRGFLLILLQFFVENLLWYWPEWFGKGSGGALQSESWLYCGVLYALGGSMIVATLLWRCSLPLLSALIITVATSSCWLPAELPGWLGWLFNGADSRWLDVWYPIFPWAGVTLFGVVVARIGLHPSGKINTQWLMRLAVGGVVLLLLWVLFDAGQDVRTITFYKYPPSVPFLLVTVIIVLVLLVLFEKLRSLNLSVLQLLGRHALFVYLLHLYLLGVVSLISYDSSMTCIMLVALCVGVLTVLGCWWLEATKGLKLFNRFSPCYDSFMQRWGLYHVESIKQALNPKGPGQSLLDVGGGTGYLASCVADRYARAVVADLSPGMLSVARSRNLETVEASATELPFKEGEFDVVLCTDALHHIKQIERAVSEMCRVLKPGGAILIHEFHVQGWKGFIFFWFERLFVDDSVFITPAELQTLMEKNGFSGKTQKLSALGFMYLGTKGRDDFYEHG